MKQVTMESVRECIAGLVEIKTKTTIGISLKEEFYLACLRELVAVTKQRDALVAENVALKEAIQEHSEGFIPCNCCGMEHDSSHDDVCRILNETPATDAAIAALRAEGAHFVANRMLAAWEAGFIEDTANNAADIARMILTSTEFMADAPAGDFDRSFADEMLKAITDQIRSQPEQIKGDK